MKVVTVFFLIKLRVLPSILATTFGFKDTYCG